jgi:hypothetical protein
LLRTNGVTTTTNCAGPGAGVGDGLGDGAGVAVGVGDGFGVGVGVLWKMILPVTFTVPEPPL